MKIFNNTCKVNANIKKALKKFCKIISILYFVTVFLYRFNKYFSFVH